MSPESALARQQAMFAAYLRDPEHCPAPPVASVRIAVYRELFFNNVRDLLAGNFPILHGILGEAEWRALIRDFYREHRCHTPLFPELGREFLAWLESRPAQPPFLHELAHYEWIELALALDESDPALPDVDPRGDLLEDIPMASPLAWPLAYRFPVHRICVDYQPDTAPDAPTFLLLCRDRNDAIHFHRIDGLTHALMLALHANPGSTPGKTLIDRLIAHQPNAEALRQQATAHLVALRERGAICGVRRVRAFA
ncbi:putative DNA-binding domain-containing protein [Xanthomonadaceae bacterium JHOS43]|nr:putative DNA-binding domain-containing protein [Xanthomonadaceae bacterium JHOS43]